MSAGGSDRPTTADNLVADRGAVSSRAAPRLFHGWVIVAAGFVATLCVGEVMWSFGVFFTSFEEQFGWSRGLISAGYTLLIVGHSISVIVAGRLTDRGLERPVLVASALLGGTAVALCSQINTPVQMHLLFLAAGLGTGTMHCVPSTVVQRWFVGRPRAGIALAVVMMGIGIGALVFAPLFRYLISLTDWHLVFIVAGVFFFIMAGLAAAFLRIPSWDRGNRRPAITEQDGKHTGPRTRDLVLTRQFLMLVGVTFSSLMAFQVVVVHVVPYASDSGLSPAAAAFALGLMGGASVPGRFLAGVMSERLGWGPTLAIVLLAEAAALIGLVFVVGDWMLIAVVAVFGAFHGARAVAVMGIVGHFFGMVALGELIGISIALGQILGAPGPYIAGHWYDISGSYSLMFALLAVGLTLVALVVARFGGAVVSTARNAGDTA
jgi:OFA family oxalate/formate antiporter-like MFS transporter